MTRNQAHIIELFQKLPDGEQRELVERLRQQLTPGDFYERLSSADRAALAEGIAEADRGHTLSPDEIRAYMAKRFALSKL